MLPKYTPEPGLEPEGVGRRYQNGSTTLRETAFHAKKPKSVMRKIVREGRFKQLLSTKEAAVPRATAAHFLFLALSSLDQLADDGLIRIHPVDDGRRYMVRVEDLIAVAKRIEWDTDVDDVLQDALRRERFRRGDR